MYFSLYATIYFLLSSPSLFKGSLFTIVLFSENFTVKNALYLELSLFLVSY
uniref:Uncharacterized protein n=1 Tax=Arundo donax TaxID=35708 RepID=A0A0A9H8L7_ARUDO